MTAQKGKDLLLKKGSGNGDPLLETFTAVGGFRSNSFTINGETIDITSKDSNGFREILDGGGIRSVSANGSGVFMDDAIFAEVNTAVMQGSVFNWQVIVPDFGTYSGPFAVSSLEMSGEHNGEVTYTISLESAGVVNFTVA